MEPMISLQGQLILDGGKLVGSPFHHSVVLVCLHDPNGALGVVLNRPGDHRLGEVATEPLPESLEQQLVYWGGPVQPGAFSCLIGAETAGPDASGYVLPGLCLVHAPDDVPECAADARLKCFSGYAGWAAGQLDHEMEQGAWLTHPGTVELVFDRQPKELWKRILVSKGPRYRLLAETPEDITRN